MINPVTADDGGIYECAVNNTAGESSANITIYGMCVIYPSIHYMQYCLVAPRFITEPQSVEASIGSAVNLSCSADGFPMPMITWSFQGMPYMDNIVNNTNSTYAERTIVLTNVTLTDGGSYSCQINSAVIVMSESSDATLAVIGGKT